MRLTPLRCGSRRAAMLVAASLASCTAMSSAAVLEYAGTWSNQTFSGTGPAMARIDTDALPVVVFTLDLRGDVFGGPFGFPPVLPLTLTGVLNPDQSVTFEPVAGHATYGAVHGSFGASGGVLIVSDPMPVSPPHVFARTLITGQRSLESIDLQFQMQTYTGIFFGSMGGIDLNLVPEPVATALIGLGVLAMRRAGPRSSRTA